jgi:hypothetical protein
MEFHIRQGASDPILKMRMIQDGKNDKTSFNNLLASGSTITFDMFDVTTGDPVVLGGECLLTNRITLYNQTTPEYYITYRFTEDQTSQVGRFEGKVTIQFSVDETPTTKLILPVKEKLYINIF